MERLLGELLESKRVMIEEFKTLRADLKALEEKHSKAIESLNQFRWKIIGGSMAGSAVVGFVFNVVLK